MAHTLNPVKDTIGFIVSRDAFLSRLPWRPIFPCHLFLDRFKDCDGGLDGKEHGASGSYHGVRGNVAQEVSLVSEKLNHCFSYFGCSSAGLLVQLRPAGLPSERRHASTCDGQDQGLEIMVGTPCSIHPIGFARCLEADPPLVQNSPWVGRCLHVLPAHNSFPSHLNFFLSQFSRCHSHTHSHSHTVLLVISPAFLGGIRPRGSSVPFFLLPLLLRVGVLVLPPLTGTKHHHQSW